MKNEKQHRDWERDFPILVLRIIECFHDVSFRYIQAYSYLHDMLIKSKIVIHEKDVTNRANMPWYIIM